MIAPFRSAALSAVNMALGLWLVAAPFVLAYHVARNATAAIWNDIVVGALIVILSVVSGALAIRGPRRREDLEAT